MASIKIIISDNFRAEFADGKWSIRATKKISKTLFRMKGQKNGAYFIHVAANDAVAHLDHLEEKCFKLAEISGDA